MCPYMISSYPVDQEIDILIIDVNDAPQLIPETYTIAIPEGFAVGTSVITVFAVDNDSGENAKLEFSLPDHTEGKFYIDSIYAAQTGVIKINEVIHRRHPTEPQKFRSLVRLSQSQLEFLKNLSLSFDVSHQSEQCDWLRI